MRRKNDLTGTCPALFSQRANVQFGSPPCKAGVAMSARVWFQKLRTTASTSNIDNVKLTLRQWIASGSALGLLLPVVFILRWRISGSRFGFLEATLWPASIMLVGLEGNRNTSEILIVYAVVIAANVILYAIIGLLTWPALRFVLRRHSQSQQ
jgi:hypothetical protein